MIKVVINRCHGGFGLSPAVVMRLIETRSVLVTTTPLTEYTGKATLEEAIVSVSSGYDGDDVTTDLGNGYRSGQYSHVFNVNTGMMYDVGYPMPQAEGESESEWYQRQESRAILFRTHPDLITIIEEMGVKAASDKYCQLTIVEIHDDDITVDDIDVKEYDGLEWIQEKSRSWR